MECPHNRSCRAGRSAPPTALLVRAQVERPSGVPVEETKRSASHIKSGPVKPSMGEPMRCCVGRQAATSVSARPMKPARAKLAKIFGEPGIAFQPCAISPRWMRQRHDTSRDSHATPAQFRKRALGARTKMIALRISANQEGEPHVFQQRQKPEPPKRRAFGTRRQIGPH